MSSTRTSATDPIRVDWPIPGLGCTFAPGKRASSAQGDSWQRDLDADLTRLVEFYRVDLLISLVEEHELGWLGIPRLVEAAGSHGLRILRSPIPDGGVPGLAAARELVSVASAEIDGDRRVVFHCRGGLGRAGTLAACVLCARGHDAEAAIKITRAARRGAIENVRQEDFVRAFALAEPTGRSSPRR